MVRRAGVVLVIVLASTCTTKPAPAPGSRTARRVALLSLDGLAADRHGRLLARGGYRDPQGLTAFAASGYVVERAVPVSPALTAPSHAAIATGAPPALTGIVSNRFHIPGAGIAETTSGFDVAPKAEALWRSFRRQGKRVAAVAYPGCGKGSDAGADLGMLYAEGTLAPPASLALDGAAFIAVSQTRPTGVTLHAPARRATTTVAFAAGSDLPAFSLTLTAIDSSDDGVAAYDTLVVDSDENPANGTLATVHAGEWFPVSVRASHADGGERAIGAWCLLQSLAPDLATVRIYRGGFCAIEAYPRAFREALEREAGLWPGPADDRALRRGIAGEGGLSPADYLTQVRRFSAFFTACARVALAHGKPDLLLAYQPIIDEVQHELTITDPRQPEYSEGLAATAAKIVDETYLIADVATGDLARMLDLSHDALVVVSDHGIAPLWEVVHVNEALRRAGLAEAGERRGRPAVDARSAIAASASSGCAHLYVNLDGREPGGVVAPERLDEVVRQAAQALALVEVDGVPAVEAMYTRTELFRLGLDAADAGDLVVFMRPGFAATGRIGGELHEPAGNAGEHGYLASHPEMHAVWLARGAAVPRERRSTAPLTEVAAFVSRLAGVAPPRDARPVKD